MDQDQLEAIQARIKASSASVTTVRNLQTEREADIGAKQAIAARKRNTGRKRKPQHMPEKTVLRQCSEVLDRHPKVAQWWRVNTGAMKMDNGRYVKFSFVGASDLMLYSTTGRFGAVECKATGKKPSDDQVAFLSNVSLAGGFAVCVDHPAELELALRDL
jgi:hypothetical protein